ncbi:MAG: hypothetical protein P8163_20165 [Candidatus Thiodiazotropha sp.]
MKNKEKKLKRAVKEKLNTKLKTKLDESKNRRVKKQTKQKWPGGAAKLLKSQRSSRVGLNQRDAWRRYGYLRSRYELYLEQNEVKTVAREHAGRDLIEEFGAEAGYSKSQLEHILS